jgi:hypothetical protein
MDIGEIFKHERIVAATIQACGVIFASFFIPKFLEKRRHDNDRKDKIIAKKEEALVNFLRYTNLTLLNQNNYKIFMRSYNSSTNNPGMSKEDILYCKRMASELYKRYILSENPYEAFCIIAQLEFPEISDEIFEFKVGIDTYIGQDCSAENDYYSILYAQYESLASKMSGILSAIRAKQ